MSRMTLEEAVAAVTAEGRRRAEREWVECLCSVVESVARAKDGLVAGRQVHIEHRVGGLWEVRCGGVSHGVISYSNHLEDVMRHSAESGWVVSRLPLTWWHRLTGRPPGWRVEMPSCL